MNNPGSAKRLLSAPHMIMLGSTGRDCGKTVFACEVIRRFRARGKLVGVKVTTVQERDGLCPHGGEGCGACSSLAENYALTEETEVEGTKDTQRLLASGADRVLWLRVLREHLEEGARALLDAIGPDTLAVCESNSLRTVLEPGVFLMIQPLAASNIKASAQRVMDLADCQVFSDGTTFDFNWEALGVLGGRWVLREFSVRGLES